MAEAKVTVCVVSYNQEPFIGPCLESLLTQETPFEFKVIVGDDASTDATPAIIADMAARDRRLVPILRKGNIGPTQNLIATHNEAQSEFVAHLDGDDLAAPGKLAAQVALLRSNPALAACGHRMALVDEAGVLRGPAYPAHLGPTFDLGKLIRVGMPVFASSVMYRRERRTLTASETDLLDWYILSDILRHGDAGFIAATLGYYRVNSGSMTGALGRERMRRQMASLHLARLGEWPDERAEFFANAVIASLAGLARGRFPPPETQDILGRSITPRAAWPIIDAARWVIQNRAAMVR
jgi:glycosyltransferase involved in cell wall biosynthesis